MKEIKQEAERVFEEVYEIVYEFQATDETLQLRARDLSLFLMNEKINTLKERQGGKINSIYGMVDFQEQVKQYIEETF